MLPDLVNKREKGNVEVSNLFVVLVRKDIINEKQNSSNLPH